MLVYQKYIIKCILVPVLLITFVSTGLIWITQILKLLYLIDKGIDISYFCKIILFIVPSLLFVIIPFVTIIGIIFVYDRLSNERQLIILKNVGLSNFKLAKPALVFSLFTTIFAYFISGFLMPYSYGKLKSNLTFIKDNHISKIITAKTFNQISKTITIFVRENSPNGELKGLVLFDNRDAENSVILFARTGILRINNNTPIIYLKEGNRQAYDSNNNLTKLYFDNISIELKNLQVGENNGFNKDINEYYINELLKPASYHTEQKKMKLIAEGHQRILWPLYSFSLTFLSLSIFLSYSYSRKFQIKPILSAASGIIIVTCLHFTSQNLAARNLQFIYLSYSILLCSTIVSIFFYNKKSI